MRGFNIIKELMYLYPLRTESARARDVVPEQPVINNNHPSYSVKELYKLQPCENRKVAGFPGRNIMIFAHDPQGNPVIGQEVSVETAYGVGMVFDHPDLRGETNERGFIEYVHPQKVTYWKIVIDGVWLIDKLWANREPTYCNPAPWPPVGGAMGGWRAVELPGDGSYRIKIMRKW